MRGRKAQRENICSLCNRPLKRGLFHDIWRDGRVYDVNLCKECNVGFTSPMPSREDLSQLYASGSYRSARGERFHSLVELLIYRFRVKRKKRIERFIKGGSILDVGCGRGLFLHLMQEGGWKVTGAEFSKETAASASETYGIPVVTGNPSEWGLGDGSFDAVTISHVLEHSFRPDEMIASCEKLLRKGGLIVVAVPNICSLQARMGRNAWFHLDVPYHLHHFSAEGLRSLLERHSFRVMKTRHFDIEYNPFGWLQTLLNLSGIQPNLVYNLLKTPELRREEFPRVKKRDLFLTLGLLPFFLPLAFFLSAYESFLLRQGGTIEVYAVKG